MRLVAALCLTLGLAACSDLTLGVDTSDPVQPQVTVAPRPSLGANGLDGRASAQMFSAVVASVEPVAERECRLRAPQYNCDLRILIDDRPGLPPNAYQTLDAQNRPVIAFTLALLGEVQNADEMAFILGHESAHHIAGHLEQTQTYAAIGAAVFGQIAGIGRGTGTDGIRTAQQIGAAVGARTFSKDFELEADALGTVIAARAGFDPVRGAAFFARIPDPGNQFLGSHPANAERIATVRRTAAGLGLAY